MDRHAWELGKNLETARNSKALLDQWIGDRPPGVSMAIESLGAEITTLEEALARIRAAEAPQKRRQ